ncbi:MAG: grasp-with-spasm system ATP-grasp peptide maturase [Flavobacterium sp.]
MILIFTTKYDFSTNEIIDYLINKNCNFVRINEDDLFEIVELNDKIIIKSGSIYIDFDSVKAVWYRKSSLQLKKMKLLNKSLENFINEENGILTEFLLFKLKKKINLGSYSGNKVNKLIVNELAKKYGLNTPQSFFSNSKKFKADKKFITKPINENSIVEIDELSFYKLLTNIPNEVNTEFAISYFQEKINKKYEIRTFYLNGKTYSMAIFSQKNLKTNLDFRNYDSENPNRTVPFQLPEDIDLKINKLMNSLSLNTGSIDILVDNFGIYYFLEVNPVGQFGMVSYPCNYNLEEKISDYLIYGK